MKKKLLNFIILTLITISVLYFALHENIKEILFIVLKANPLWIFVGILLVAGYSFIKGYIAQKLVVKFKKNYSFKSAFSLQLMTNFFNAITPFSTGGQPFQIYLLKKNRISLTNATSIITAITIIHQLALIFLIFIFLLLNSILNITDHFIIILVIVGLLINTLFVGFLILIGFSKKFNNFIFKYIISLLVKLRIIKKQEETLKKINQVTDNFSSAIKLLVGNKWEFVKMVGLNVLSLITFYLVPLVVLFSLGDYSSYNGFQAIILTTFTASIGSFVPLPGGSGGQEYSFILLFGTYVTNPLLGSIMLIWRFLTYYLPMFVGAIILGLRRKK